MNIHIDNDGMDLSELHNQNQNDELIQKQTKRGKKKEQIHEQIPDPSYEAIQELIPDIKLSDKHDYDHEDVIYKAQLLRKINQYQKYFYEFLGKINFERMENKTTSELETILTEIKQIVSNRNIEGNIDRAIQYIPFGIERIGITAGLQLEGYAQMVSRDKEYAYCMAELLIEYNFMDNLKVDNRLRLGYILASSAYLVHTINSNKKAEINEKLNTCIDPTKYNDL